MSDFRPCRECRNWRECLLTETEKEWFSYSNIRFCPLHVFWLLRYEEVIRGQRWPEPDDNTEGMSSRAMSEAAFTKASLLLAELYQRIDRTGLKGELLASESKHKEKVQYLSPSARDALFYVSGDNRKRMGFSEWLRQRKHRRREYKSVVIVQT